MLALIIAAQAAAAPASSLGWLAGDWVQCSSTSVVQERWLGPERGTLVGANLTRGPRSTSYEFFRVAQGNDGSWAFHAQPGGNPPVPFAAIELGPARVVFENRANDFPQRVIYWRDGANLRARIEGTIEGRTESEEWTFVPVTDPNRPCG